MSKNAADLNQSNLAAFETDLTSISSHFKVDIQNINKAIQFSLIPYQEQYMRIEIIISNEKYLTYKYFFIDIATFLIQTILYNKLIFINVLVLRLLILIEQII